MALHERDEIPGFLDTAHVELFKPEGCRLDSFFIS